MRSWNGGHQPSEKNWDARQGHRSCRCRFEERVIATASCEDAGVGAWGVGIFSNDTASDIREDFRDLVGEGVSARDATLRLVGEYGVDASSGG